MKTQLASVIRRALSKRACLPAFLLLAWPALLGGQGVLPVTEAPVPPLLLPQESLSLFPTDHPDNVFPRWLPYVNIDPLIVTDANGEPEAVQSNISGAGIAVDEMGNTHIVGSRQGEGIYYFNDGFGERRNNGFSGAELIGAAGAGTLVSKPALAFGPNGVLYAVWSASAPPYHTEDIYLQRREGGSWLPSPITLTVTPLIEMDCGGAPQVFFAEKNNEPQLAVDDFGILHLLFHFERTFRQICDEPPFIAEGLKYMKLDPILSVLFFQDVAFDNFSHISNPRIALDSGSEAHIAWQRQDHGTNISNIFYASEADGWAPVLLGFGTNEQSPDLIVDRSDSIHLTWAENPAQAASRVLYQKKTEEGFAEIEVVSTRPGSAPNIGLDRQDQAQIIWADPASGLHGYAARIDHPGIGADPWLGRQEPAAIEPSAGLELFPLDIYVDQADGISLVGVDLSGNKLLYTRTHDFNLGMQDPLTHLEVAPNTVANLVNGNLFFNLPLFSSAGAGFATGLSLYYNSQDHRPSPWIFNYHIYLVDSWTGYKDQTGATEDVITLFFGDGSSVVFRYNATLGYHIADTEFGYFARLERSGDPSAPTYTLTGKHGMVHRFNSQGKIVESEDRNGNKQMFEYQNGWLYKITDSVGRETIIERDADGKPTTVTDPAGQQYGLNYNSLGLLGSVEFLGAPAGDVIKWDFGYHQTDEEVTVGDIPDVFRRAGALSEIFTPRGRQENYSSGFYYLPDGRLRMAYQPEAAYKEEDGTMANDQAAIVMTYLGELPGETPSTVVRGRRGSHSSITHKRRQNLATSVTDQEGYTSFYEYDACRCPTGATDNSGAITLWEYYDPTETQPPFIGDNLKAVSRQKDDGTFFIALACTYSDDGFNLPLTFEDFLGAVTSLAYDPVTLNLESITYPEASLQDGTTEILTESFEYNAQGVMIQHTGERGNVTTCPAIDPTTGLPSEYLFPGNTDSAVLTYDDMGNCTSYTEPGGGTTTFTLDGLYRVILVTEPATEAGVCQVFQEYDLNSNPIRAYDNLLGSSDPFYEIAYDQLDRPLEIKNAREQSAFFWYDRNDNTVCAQDFRGVKDRTFYDARNLVREEVADFTSPLDGEPLYGRCLYEYDCCYDCIQTTCVGADPADNQATTFDYDIRHNLTGVNHAEDDIVEVIEYDCNDLPISCTLGLDEGGAARAFNQTVTAFNRTEFEYDEIYRLVGLKQVLLQSAGALATKIIHKEGGARQIVEGPLGFQSSVLENGRYLPTDLLKHDQATLTQQLYNDRNLPTETRIVNPLDGSLATVATRLYNGRNQLISQTDPFSNTATYKYDLRGRLMEVTDEAGFKSQLSYNELDQVESVIRAAGAPEESRILSEFDAHGNETLRTVWNPATQVYDAAYEMLYDNANRLVKMTFPAIPGQSGNQLSMTWKYDEFGNLAAFTDRNGKTTAYEYDRMNRLRVETHDNPNYPDHGRRIEYAYDPPGNLVLLLERAGTGAASPEVFREENEYDAINRLTKQSWFLDGAAGAYQEMNFVYDDASRLVSCTDGEGVAYEFFYNEDHWLTGLSGPDGTFVQFGYDAGGRRTDAWLGLPSLGDTQNATAHIQYEYDQEVRLTGIETNGGGRLLNRILCQYDERDNRSHIDYEHLNASVDFDYDGLNRLVSEDWSATAECADFLADLPGGAETAAAGFFPAAPAAGFPPTVRTYLGQYAFDPAGNRTSKTINGETTSYSYNAQNQLIEAAPPNADAIAYQYDANGNQAQRTQGGRQETFRYDFYNRLADYRRQENGSLSTHYTYLLTPAGQRYAKQDQLAGQAQWFKYIGHDVYGDYEQSAPGGELKAKTLYLNGLSIDSKMARIGVAEDGSFTGKNWYLPDPLGSAHQLIDADANITNLQMADAWGVPMPEDFMALVCEVQDRYQGLAQREIDGESGLQYTRARHYDAESGRFLAVDPLLDNAIGEHFGYAGGNPVMGVDPMGLESKKEVGRFVERIGKKVEEGTKLAEKLDRTGKMGEFILGAPSSNIDELAKHVEAGGDVLVYKHSHAKKIARRAGQGKPPILDPPHGPRQLKHYHPYGRKGGHVFIGRKLKCSFVGSPMPATGAGTATATATVSTTTTTTATAAAKGTAKGTATKVTAKAIAKATTKATVNTAGKVALKVSLGVLGWGFEIYEGYVIVKTSKEVNDAYKTALEHEERACTLERKRKEMIENEKDIEKILKLWDLVIREKAFFRNLGQPLPPATQLLEKRLMSLPPPIQP